MSSRPEPGPITDADGDGQPDPSSRSRSRNLDTPATEPTSASDLACMTPAIERQLLQTLDCTDPANRTGGGGDDPTKALVTCSVDGTVKYVLGPRRSRFGRLQPRSCLRTTAQGRYHQRVDRATQVHR